MEVNKMNTLINVQALDSYISNAVDRQVKEKVRAKGPDKQWLNQKESAKYMGISVNTFIAWRKKWKLESRTIENVTRWNKRDLDRFWFEHGVQGYL